MQCFWKSCSFHRFRHRHPTFVSPILVFVFKIIPHRPHFPTCEENPTEKWSFLLWKSVHKVFIIHKLNETKNKQIQMFSLQQCLLQIYGKVPGTFIYLFIASSLALLQTMANSRNKSQKDTLSHTTNYLPWNSLGRDYLSYMHMFRLDTITFCTISSFIHISSFHLGGSRLQEIWTDRVIPIYPIKTLFAGVSQ